MPHRFDPSAAPPHVARARQFAIEQHAAAGVRYGEHPFSYHLDAVADELVKFGHDEDFAIAAAMLHDVCEDTPTTIGEIRHLFGDLVGDHVDAVTDIKFDAAGRLLGNRRARQTLTYDKTRMYAKRHGDSVINVKLADRIANMAETVATESDHLKMYYEEHVFFSEQLQHVGGDPVMWNELDRMALACARTYDTIRMRKALHIPLNADVRFEMSSAEAAEILAADRGITGKELIDRALKRMKESGPWQGDLDEPRS